MGGLGGCRVKALQSGVYKYVRQVSGGFKALLCPHSTSATPNRKSGKVFIQAASCLEDRKIGSFLWWWFVQHFSAWVTADL